MFKSNKYYCYWVVLLLFTSCVEKENAQLELKLINKEVFFVEFVQPEDSVFFSYKSKEQRIKSTNLITYKLSNPTNNKVAFVIKDLLWYPVNGKIEKSKYGEMFFVIKDSVSIAGIEIPMINFLEESFNQTAFDIFIQNDSIKKFKYELIMINTDDFLLENIEIIDHFISNVVVLHPNETITFNTLLKLPIVREVDIRVGEYDFLCVYDIEKFDKFQIYYSADAEYLKSVLPEYLLKELEENQIEIFDGVLMSNEVPLIKR
jgi:hypothetical protein